MAFQITGNTRDNTGNLVGSVEVYLLKYNSGTHLFTQIARTTSDAGTGSFSFLGLADNDPAYNIVAFKDGTPHVFDISDRNVRPTLTGGADPIAIFGSNLLAWYKADTGLTAQGGGAPVNGNRVSQMNDNSTNAYNMSQYAINLGPIYQSAGLNSLPALICTNNSSGPAESHLQTATDAVSLGGQAFSVFIVCQLDSATISNSRIFCFLGTGDDADITHTTSIGILRDATNNLFTSYRNSTQQSIQAISTGTTVHIGMVYDGANTLGGGAVNIPYLNGVAGTPSSVEGGDVFASVGTLGLCTQFTSGAAGGPLIERGWTGPIAEIVVVKAAASATQAANLTTYFTSRGF